MSDVEENASKGSDESELHAAAWSGDLEWVRAILEKGADVNWRDLSGETALFGACGWGRVEVVAYLLAQGASVNIQDNYGLTPLHWLPVMAG